MPKLDHHVRGFKTHWVRERLQAGEVVTTIRAYEAVRLTDLPSTIYQLRKRGMLIEGKLIRRTDGTSYSEYRMVSGNGAVTPSPDTVH